MARAGPEALHRIGLAAREVVALLGGPSPSRNPEENATLRRAADLAREIEQECSILLCSGGGRRDPDLPSAAGWVILLAEIIYLLSRAGR